MPESRCGFNSCAVIRLAGSSVISRLAGSQTALMAFSQNASVRALARDSTSANDPWILDESATDRDV